MLKYLAKLFHRNTEPERDRFCSAPLASNQPASAAEGESASIRREALGHFMRLVTAHLGDDESRRLMDAMLASFDTYGNSSEAFEEIALGKGGQKIGRWFVIQCDWKASEEVAWQIAKVASSFGISERWNWREGIDEQDRTVPAGLCEVANWAAPLGLEMLHIDIGSDTYYAILIRQEDAESAHQAALSAGLKLQRTPEFAAAHA